MSVGCFSKLRQRIKLQAQIPIKTIFMFPLLSWKTVINLLCRASASLFSPSANKIKAIHEIRLKNLTLFFLEVLELPLTVLEEAEIILAFFVFSPSGL